MPRSVPDTGANRYWTVWELDGENGRGSIMAAEQWIAANKAEPNA
jgi:hypothetical protein